MLHSTVLWGEIHEFQIRQIHWGCLMMCTDKSCIWRLTGEHVWNATTVMKTRGGWSKFHQHSIGSLNVDVSFPLRILCTWFHEVKWSKGYFSHLSTEKFKYSDTQSLTKWHYSASQHVLLHIPTLSWWHGCSFMRKGMFIIQRSSHEGFVFKVESKLLNKNISH